MGNLIERAKEKIQRQSCVIFNIQKALDSEYIEGKIAGIELCMEYLEGTQKAFIEGVLENTKQQLNEELLK